jgi:hypothetical protein
MYSVGDEEENSTVIIPTSPKSFMTIEKSCDHIDTNYNIALSIIVYYYWYKRHTHQRMCILWLIYTDILTKECVYYDWYIQRHTQ